LPQHCEATHPRSSRADCFASLAMTQHQSRRDAL
jgi:hypothetical protein